jgi:hypothetical protein
VTLAQSDPTHGLILPIHSTLLLIDQCFNEISEQKLHTHQFGCATMDNDADSQSFLQTVLGLFARKRPQSSAKPASLNSRRREAWLRTDAFLQCDDIGDADPESVARTLRALEHLVQDDSDRERDFVGILAKQHTPVLRSVGLSRLAY